jgi:hypothetical protein
VRYALLEILPHRYTGNSVATLLFSSYFL